MKKVIAGAMAASVLMGSVFVQGAEVEQSAETRKAAMELNGIQVEFEETLHECAQGYSLWYSSELLKESVFGGNECFIPAAEDDALESAVRFIVVVEDDENTVLGLDETLGAYESTGETYETLEISEVETKTLESELLVDYATVICNDTADYFYQVRDEAGENVLYISATVPVEEQDVYAVWFDRMVETIEFTTDALSSVDFVPDVLTCSLCEVEKECYTYEADGAYYDVCDDCFNEFAAAFDLYGANDPTCGLCEATSDCDVYEVDGQSYYVCAGCYNEFATAFGLN